MKKIPLWFSILLFLSSSISFAWSIDNQYFRITVQNNTPETCVLAHQRLLHGTISSSTPVPEKLISGTENTFLLQEKNVDRISSISLTYQCGGSRFIQFLSQRDQGLKNIFTGPIVTGKILLANDMDAIYEVQQGTLLGGYIFEAQAGAILWILS
ncbi:MAG: hypothetical protein ACO1N3_03960 [Gammaproteobacteria bacterium]